MAMRAGGGAPGRKKDFKKVTDLEDARRKREDNIIELRKNKRDENLQKKRQVVHLPGAGAGGAGGPGGGLGGAGGLAMDDAAARAGSQHKVSTWRCFELEQRATAGAAASPFRRRRRLLMPPPSPPFHTHTRPHANTTARGAPGHGPRRPQQQPR